MNPSENTEVMTDTGENKGETNTKEENKGEKTNGESPQNGTANASENKPPQSNTTNVGESKPSQNDNTNTDDKKKKRKHFTPSVNVGALRELEGITTSSFTDLVIAVILIDGKPYNKKTLPITKNRQNTFKRLIEHYAVLECVGDRQYYIKIVYSDKQIEELREARVNAIKR